MKSEEDKYYLIHQLLKDKLTEEEKKQLFSAGDWQEQAEEIRLHKLVNEIVEENHLLEIKQITRNVIQKNSSVKYGKWITGFVLVTGLAGAGYFLIQDEKKSFVKELEEPKQLVITKREKVLETVNETVERPSYKLTSPKPKSTVNTIKPSLPQVEEPSLIPLPQEQGLVYEESPVKELIQTKEVPKAEPKSVIPEVTSNPIPQQEKKAFEETPAIAELILNPDRNEIISFPVSSDYDGLLSIFDASGSLIYQQAITKGFPNTWNGQMQNGSYASSGMYGFILKSREGKEMPGYITVIR